MNERKFVVDVKVVMSIILYVIGLQSTMDGQFGDLNLNLNEIRQKLVNYRTAVVDELQNNQPVIKINVDIQAEVYKENNSDEVFKLILLKTKALPQIQRWTL